MSGATEDFEKEEQTLYMANIYSWKGKLQDSGHISKVVTI